MMLALLLTSRVYTVTDSELRSARLCHMVKEEARKKKKYLVNTYTNVFITTRTNTHDDDLLQPVSKPELALATASPPPPSFTPSKPSAGVRS